MKTAKVNQVKDLSEYEGVTVIAQQNEGEVAPASLELIGEAGRLSREKNSPLYIVILGNNIDKAVDQVSRYGAEKVFYYEHELLDSYSTDAYTKAVSDFIKDRKPEIVLFSATSFGRDFAPRVAARIGTGLTADCTALDVDEDDGKLVQTRPAFGGNLMAKIICPDNRPQMATVRPGVMDKPESLEESSEVVKQELDFTEGDVAARVVNTVMSEKTEGDIKDATIVVAGGRGVGSEDGFEVIRELADELGGAVGSSRAAVDRGWIAEDHQVGQTGSTIQPELYIACGISGAVQHMVGMENSDYIIAINKDAEAPIMKKANLAIEGDLFEVVPELIERIKRTRNGEA